MEEKFFDLKKEKQDRIFNAAMEIFAVNGYDNGSTQEIVKKAGISKGLLFHYFETKKELYYFLYDYCFRVLQLEVRSSSPATGEDYFDLVYRLVDIETTIMGHYPYMIAFLEKGAEVKDPELDKMQDMYADYRKLLSDYLEKADIENLRPEVDLIALKRLVHVAICEVRRRLGEKGMLEPIAYKAGISRYLDMLVKLSRK